MKTNKPTIDYDELAENTPLTDGEIAQFRPLDEVMPPDFVKMALAHQTQRAALGKVRKPRGKQRAPTKQAVSIRLSPDVLAAFRATGKGWQARIDDILRQHVASL